MSDEIEQLRKELADGSNRFSKMKLDNLAILTELDQVKKELAKANFRNDAKDETLAYLDKLLDQARASEKNTVDTVCNLAKELDQVKKDRDALRKTNDRYSIALQQSDRKEQYNDATIHDLTRST